MPQAQDHMPPLTLDELLGHIANENFKTYVVLTSEQDVRWAMARNAELLLAGVRAYLVKPAGHRQVRDWYELTAKDVGLVFNREGTEFVGLTASESKDFLTIAKAIAEA